MLLSCAAFPRSSAAGHEGKLSDNFSEYFCILKHWDMAYLLSPLDLVLSSCVMYKAIDLTIMVPGGGSGGAVKVWLML